MHCVQRNTHARRDVDEDDTGNKKCDPGTTAEMRRFILRLTRRQTVCLTAPHNTIKAVARKNIRLHRRTISIQSREGQSQAAELNGDWNKHFKEPYLSEAKKQKNKNNNNRD